MSHTIISIRPLVIIFNFDKIETLGICQNGFLASKDAKLSIQTHINIFMI